MLSRARTLIGLLTTRQSWGALGLVLLIVLLWSARSALGLSVTVARIGTVVLLVLGAIAFLVARRRAARNAKALERSMHGQAEDQLFSVRPERREQIEQVEREFAAAVDALKRSKVGKRQPGQLALYALPWYVVIGPPAAGKTSAITESGLDFPMGANRVRGIGGTRNCDWFFSTSAILLDTAGRYMTVEEDRDEWLTFLGLLKQYRRRTPRNGGRGGGSIDEIHGAPADELQQLAADLRRRMDELLVQLGIRFPLYLVFTKCDLLRGFTEFFADLDPAARGQVWGCTVPRGTAADDAVRQQFEQEFDVLTRTLIARRAARLASLAADADAAREVYLFPLEFASIRDTLATFVGQLLHPNPYQDTPQFRGFYFTSALQGGAPLDRVLPALADRYNLSRWDAERAPTAEPSRSYFLESLFSDVIIRDRGRVAPTSRAAMARERVRRGAIAATLLGLVGFAWMTASAYAGSRADLNVARSAVSAVARQRDLRSLDSLDRAIALLEERDTSGYQIWRVGLDRSARVLPEMRGAYVRHARPYLNAPLLSPIEQRLRTYTAATPDAYNDLRAYLLLGREVGRLQTSTDEEQFLQRHFRRHLAGRPGDTVYTDRFVNALSRAEHPEPVLQTDSQLVERARAILYVAPTLDRLYADLRDEGMRRLPPVQIVKLLGQPAFLPFDPSSTISGLYTKAAWEGFVQEAIEERSRRPGRTDWVIGARPDRLPVELADPDSVAGALLKRYFEDYIIAWQAFLSGVRYPAGDMATSARTLGALGDPAKSPLVALLDTVSAETRFENATVAGTRQKLSEFMGATMRKLGYVRTEGSSVAPRNPVDRSFAQLHALRQKSEAPALAKVLDQYVSFGQSLQASASDLGSAGTASDLAKEAARARIAVINALPTVAPDIRTALFERPFDIAEGAVKEAAGGAMSQKWNDQVCQPFRALAGRYPFADRADEVTIGDVERFFQPQTGAIWAFYERELGSTLSPATFEPVQGGSRGVSVPRSVIGTLQQARRIRDGLFGGSGGMHATLRLTPTPLTIVDPPAQGRAPVPTEVCLTIDGQQECYKNGSVFDQEFEWPSKQSPRANRVVVTVSTPNRPPEKLSIEAAGEWGWFRLLDHATVTSVGGGRQRVEWTVRHPTAGYGVRVSYTLSAGGGDNPFNRRSVFGQFKCASAS